MKISLAVTALCLLLVGSWVLFIPLYLEVYEQNIRLEDSLDIKGRLDYLSDQVDNLWDERVFEREMRENLSYYLPEGFSSQVKYVGLTPLDLEYGNAKVYFIHRNKNYSVNLSYYYDNEGRLKIERESGVDFLK